MNKRFSSEQGAALIMALFVVALVAAIAASMMTRIQIETRQTELILDHNQANFYAEGALAWAIDQLITDFQQQKPQQVLDKTPIQSPVNPLNNGKIDSVIVDAQGKFNLNNLTKQEERETFLRLLRIVEPKLTPNAAQAILLATADWISSTVNHDFEEFYSKLNPPYRAPHRLMASVSELRLVKGMTAELYAKLTDYVTALPEPTPVNINNAEVPLIQSLSPSMSADAAKIIALRCKQQPFATVQQFSQFDVAKNNPIADSKITTISSYFLLKTNVTVDQTHLIVYTLLQRLVQNARPSMKVVWQSKGTV